MRQSLKALLMDQLGDAVAALAVIAKAESNIPPKALKNFARKRRAEILRELKSSAKRKREREKRRAQNG